MRVALEREGVGAVGVAARDEHGERRVDLAEGAGGGLVVEGTRIAKYEPVRGASGFVEGRYDVPAELVRGKQKVTVRFQAGAPNGRIVPIYGVRVVRADRL